MRIEIFPYRLRPLLVPGIYRKIDVLGTEPEYMDVPVKKPGIVGYSLIYIVIVAGKIAFGLKRSLQLLKRFCWFFLMILFFTLRFPCNMFHSLFTNSSS